MSTQLILIRHGESTSNVGRIATSAAEGYPLTDRGRYQASAVGRELAEVSVDHIYCSPIQRARETAGIIGGFVVAPISIRPGLEEIDVGIHEGRSEDDVAVNAVTNFERWLSFGDLNHGFEGGENAVQAADRVSRVLVELARRHDNGTAIVVSHGGALALSLIRLCHNVPADFVWANLLDNCAAVAVSVDGDAWTCLSWAGIPLEGTPAGR
jgi:broad specificity phosphatase PhoE